MKKNEITGFLKERVLEDKCYALLLLDFELQLLLELQTPQLLLLEVLLHDDDRLLRGPQLEVINQLLLLRPQWRCSEGKVASLVPRRRPIGCIDFR